MHKSIVVLGGSGFIGKRLIRHLLNIDVTPIVIKRSQSKTAPELRNEELQYVNLSTDSYDGLSEALESYDIDAIVNCAAYGVSPSARSFNPMYQVNVGLPLALVNIASDHMVPIVHLGSSAEYAGGQLTRSIQESDAPEVQKLYGCTKYAGGALMTLKAAELNVASAILRLFHVYGPGERDHRLLPTLISKLSNGQRVPMSEGTQVRDFVHVDDAVNAIMTALLGLSEGSLENNQAYNISTGSGQSVRQFSEAVAAYLGAPASLLGFGDVEMRPDEIMYLTGDNMKFTSQTEWRPQFDFESGIKCACRELHSQA